MIYNIKVTQNTEDRDLLFKDEPEYVELVLGSELLKSDLRTKGVLGTLDDLLNINWDTDMRYPAATSDKEVEAVTEFYSVHQVKLILLGQHDRLAIHYPVKSHDFVSAKGMMTVRYTGDLEVLKTYLSNLGVECHGYTVDKLTDNAVKTVKALTPEDARKRVRQAKRAFNRELASILNMNSNRGEEYSVNANNDICITYEARGIDKTPLDVSTTTNVIQGYVLIRLIFEDTSVVSVQMGMSLLKLYRKYTAESIKLAMLIESTKRGCTITHH